MKPTEGYGTVAIDADGTLLEYDGWKGLGQFGKPLKGAKAAMQQLKSLGYEIVIFTTRGDDIGELEEHLQFWGIPFDRINCNSPEMPANLSRQKIMADVYIDDRVIAFGGNWNGMIDRIKMFQPWYKRDNKRPTLDLQVAGYHVDQISLYVQDVAKSIASYSLLGHSKWVIDKVEAYDGFRDQQFKVKLAFNYTIMPIEFELLEIVAGDTVQVDTGGKWPCGLSHYGFHVDDIHKAIVSFQKQGFEMISDVVTKTHSQCPDRYRYVFIDTSTLGFISKLIRKID